MFEWIEGFYNPHRRHSALGYLSPADYEALHTAADMDDVSRRVIRGRPSSTIQ